MKRKFFAAMLCALHLSVSTYVEQEDTREKIDIVKLNAEIREIVVREQVLRDEIDKIIAENWDGKLPVVSGESNSILDVSSLIG